MSDAAEASQKRSAGKEGDTEPPLAKRPRLEDAASISSSGGVTVDYQWLDGGVLDPETGRNYHSSIRLTVEGSSFDVHIGDVVQLYAEEAEDRDAWICKVHKLWDDGDAVSFSGFWFLSREEINQYTGPWDGVMTKAGLIKKMRSKERVLSDRSDENDIGSILSCMEVVHQVPGFCIDVPRHCVLCRYRLETTGTRWTLFDYKGGDSVGRDNDHVTEEHTMTNDTLDDDSSTSSSGASSTLSDQVRFEGEGSNLRGDIQVGPKYQVHVPVFTPGAPFVTDRKPQLVWKANAISDDDLHSFLERLSTVLNPYLQNHSLTTLDGPIYTPLPLEKAEALMHEKNIEKLYPSHLSTSSSLTPKSNALLKECDVDAVLQLLHGHDYDANKALEAIQSDLQKVANGWTKTEKLIFNDGYRQEQGAIRNIAKLFHPMKNHKDVVDYWYRFKMADQFRLYQEKKRDQAIRMMECIEKRRYHEVTLSVPRVGASEGHATDSHWSETSVADLATATEDRRRTARALLMDVTETFDHKVTAEIAAVLRELHESYDAKLKKHLFALLAGHPELQQRFLAFLPKS